MHKPKNLIAFQIVHIKTDEFAIIEELFEQDNPEINLALDFAYSISKGEKIIACSVEVKYLQEDKPFIKLKITNKYWVEDKSWEQLQNENKITVPKDFAMHLLVLTIGTLRGVLHAKTEGTEFNKFLLPTLNVADLIKTDLVFEF